ncbi:MAG: 30S ribosome-binding factor RbfA [Candidatus Sumerlaeia bacterium]|nr:30S ribosome-binding factor RbfA [Candidatus Sumerlaeia bacterium]
MSGNRHKRVGEEIRKYLSTILQSEVSDPRLPAIFTITDVVVTKDLRHAKVYFSQLPDNEDDLDKTVDFLDASIGFLRSRVAQELNMKFCPQLDFRYDESTSNFQSINKVLHKLREDGADLDSPPEEQ